MMSGENQLQEFGSLRIKSCFLDLQVQEEIMISGGHGTLSCDEVRYNLYVS